MRKKEKGQSLVEMALLLPVLLLMLLGLLDFGRVYYAMVAMNDAAQEGAAYAAMHPNDPKIRERATAASTGLITIQPENVTVVLPPPDSLQAGAPVTVIVSYDFTFYTPVAQSFFGDNTVTLQAQATNAIIATSP